MFTFVFTLTLLFSASALLPSPAMAQQTLVIKPLAEKKIADLPPGPLFWRIENFANLAEAQGSAISSSLVAESAGKVWVFTLGAAGGSTPGATKVGEVGPIAQVAASQYLLRVNDVRGAPGSITPIHSHPGSEAFFVLTGEQSIRTPSGLMRITAGKPEAGGSPDTPMQVSSSGETDLHALVMFVVDATRAFSSPAAFP